MKTRCFFLVAIFLACLGRTAGAQTLKWAFSVTPASFASDYSYAANFGNDTAGDSATIVLYSQGGKNTGYRLLWLLASGKQRLSTEFQVADFNDTPQVYRVTASAVILKMIDSSANTFLRKFFFANGVLKTTDVAVTDSDALPDPVFPDPSGFFMFHQDNNSQLTEIRRYKN